MLGCMTKKTIFKIGDRVKILKPEVVVRVGYPLTTYDCLDEVREKYSEAISDLMIKADMPWYNSDGYKVVNGIERSLAYGLLMKKKFGGNERSLHKSKLYYSIVSDDGKDNKIGEIVSKRVVRTGFFENGKLTKQKSHVLIKVKHHNEWVNEFEAENLEKVTIKNESSN